MTMWNRVRMIVEVVVVGLMLWHAYLDHANFHKVQTWVVKADQMMVEAQQTAAPKPAQ